MGHHLPISDKNNLIFIWYNYRIFFLLIQTVTKEVDSLTLFNSGNNEDSLDMELLAAPTQVYVADSEDDGK